MRRYNQTDYSFNNLKHIFDTINSDTYHDIKGGGRWVLERGGIYKYTLPQPFEKVWIDTHDHNLCLRLKSFRERCPTPENLDWKKDSD